MKRKVNSVCMATFVALFLGCASDAFAADPEAVVCDSQTASVSLIDVDCSSRNP